MKIEIYIAPHERHEAIEASADRLTPSQVKAIKDAEEDAEIVFTWDAATKTGSLLVDPWPGLKMNILVVIEPHERVEALEAYRQWLSLEQETEIIDAPDSALIRLARSNGKTTVQVIEEG